MFLKRFAPALGVFLLGAFLGACAQTGVPSLTPRRLRSAESDRVTLRVVGLAPSVYLETSSRGLSVASDLSVRIGGADAVVLGAGGAGLDVRLTSVLPVGFYDLFVRARGHEFLVIDALEIVGNDEDAGPDDAGPFDGGPIDAGLVDGGPIDAGLVDGGPIDAGLFDGGPIDAGLFDGGPIDAGLFDGGPIDAGLVDGGPIDAGLDAGDASTVPPLCPSDPALVGCWPLDGNALDASGRGNHFTTANVTYPATGGVLLAAASSMSRSARAELRHAGLSFDAWIRLDVMPAAGRRAGIVDHEGQFGLFVYGPNDLVCSAALVGAGATATPNPISLGVWHHVACVADAGLLSVYVDGVMVRSTPAPGGTVANQPLHLGENAPDGADQFRGAIDDARLWDRPLSATEIIDTVAIGRRLE